MTQSDLLKLIAIELRQKGYAITEKIYNGYTWKLIIRRDNYAYTLSSGELGGYDTQTVRLDGEILKINWKDSSFKWEE
jgi:hypothetical protein